MSPSACASRQPDLPGAAESLGAAVRGSGRTRCRPPWIHRASLLEEASAALSASGHAIGWGYRYHVPYTTALAMRGRTSEAAAALGALDNCSVRFGHSTMSGASPGHGWPPARAPSTGDHILQSAAETAAAKGRFAAE